MLRKSGLPEWIFGPLLAVLIFVMGFVVGSSPHPSGITEQKTATKTYDTADYYYPYYVIRDWFSKDAAGFFTALLFFVGFFQLALFYGQLRLIRKTLAPAEDAAKAARDNAIYLRTAERPFMAPVGIRLEGWEKVRINPGLKTHFLSVHCDISNFGKGPGFVIDWGNGHEICAEGTAQGTNIKTREEKTRVFIPADGRWKFPTILAFDRFSISNDDGGEIFNSDKVLYVYGFIRYLDFFGVTRRTGFLYEFVPDKQSAANSGFVVADGTGSFWYDIEEKTGE